MVGQDLKSKKELGGIQGEKTSQPVGPCLLIDPKKKTEFTWDFEIQLLESPIFFNVFVYFWLCWVFIAVHGLSLVAESRFYFRASEDML